MSDAPSRPNNLARLHLGLGVVVYSVLLGVVVALIADYYEIGFKYMADFWHRENLLFSTLPNWLLYAIGPFCAGPILYLMLSYIPEKRPHNPADLIMGIHIDNGHINAKAALLTALASSVSIAFGYSVGYYAPTLLLGAGMGALFHRLRWICPTHAYISIGAGAAAAIAAIFHSPIGAVVFVHEVLFRFFSIRAFAPVTIAAVSAYVVSSELFDKVVFFEVPAHEKTQILTYFVAAFAGILAALVGIILIKSILAVQRLSQARHLGSNAKILIASVITAVIIVFVPDAAGSSLQAMQNVLSGAEYALAALIILFVMKLAATGTAIGFGIPGGIFGPTIFIGAALGGIVAEVMILAAPALADAHQIIIITTMAAMLSAVLGAPIAMILIIIEMTGDFHLISIVMLSVVMANITAFRLMGTSSFFDIQLKSRGLDIDAGRDRLHAEHHGIADLISDDYIAISATTDIAEVEKLLVQSGKTAAYSIDDDGNLIGRVALIDIEYHQLQTGEDSNVEALVKKDYPSLYRNTSIWQAMQMMTAENARCLPVIDGENNPKLLGVVYTQPLMSRYFENIRRLRNEENVTSH